MQKNILHLLVIFCVISSTINSYEIRLYKAEDKPVLVSMLRGNPDLLVLGNTLEKRVLKTAPYFGSKNYTTKVCVEDNVVIGFITYQKTIQTNKVIRFFLGNPGCFQLLNVLKEHHRKGVGSALVKDALEDMEKIGFESVTLQTKTANAASRALYEKHGFKLIFSFKEDCLYKRDLKKKTGFFDRLFDWSGVERKL